jgi:hypothetical protein
MSEFQARVLYDFTAEGETELNIRQTILFTVSMCSADPDPGYRSQLTFIPVLVSYSDIKRRMRKFVKIASRGFANCMFLKNC